MRPSPDPIPLNAPFEFAGVLRASPIPAVPADPSNAVADDPRAAELGRLLFYDARFSANAEVFCASRHDPDLDWSDGEATATGLRSFPMHSPSLWNVGHNRWFLWDGRVDLLWAQTIQVFVAWTAREPTRSGVLQIGSRSP